MRVFLLVTAAVLTSVSGAAHAKIMGMIEVGPPGSVARGILTSNTSVQGWRVQLQANQHYLVWVNGDQCATAQIRTASGKVVAIVADADEEPEVVTFWTPYTGWYMFEASAPCTPNSATFPVSYFGGIDHSCANAVTTRCAIRTGRMIFNVN